MILLYLKKVFNAYYNSVKVNLTYTGKRKAEEEYGVIAPKRRFFASANEAYPDSNFFIEPEVEVEKVAQFLLQRKFTLLFGHCQSGKSTTCHAILRWFRDHPEKIREAGFDPQKLEIRMVTFDATVNTKDPSVLWESICKKFRTTDRKLFSFDTAEKCTSSTFQDFFSKRYLLSPKPIILIVDEASRLSAGDDCTVEFIDSLRTLKGDRVNFCLISIILVGTATIRDFLISHQRPNAISKISPFSAEACLTCSQFTKAEVEDLFKQFATSINDSFDFINIAPDIFEFTLGHKGLVGACGDYIQNAHSYNNTPIQTLDD
ncbi:7145_t:CDS:2 [Funneliformis caledonium]|uniref:7145_t:CDS:1 n=1 Tax=Funneliformis caledonium TaxID=1117310 RepID=A0A9N8WKV9_9GLOM|nr:7145_t:CDS:2 [Funneliformis caledonium]